VGCRVGAVVLKGWGEAKNCGHDGGCRGGWKVMKGGQRVV